ncbi:MAG: hypothetical protein ACRDY5_08760, partial [Acidimicrobiales bacterium]
MSQLLASEHIAHTPADRTEDRRLRVMRSLVVEDWLVGEWDPQRLLLTARPGGPLNRHRACAVPDC